MRHILCDDMCKGGCSYALAYGRGSEEACTRIILHNVPHAGSDLQFVMIFMGIFILFFSFVIFSLVKTNILGISNNII